MFEDLFNSMGKYAEKLQWSANTGEGVGDKER